MVYFKVVCQLWGKFGVQCVFNDEMKVFQDCYYEVVGKYCGLLCVGLYFV